MLKQSHTFSFASDNHAGAHPEILKALTEVNHGTVSAYGADPFTEEMEREFKKTFGENTLSFPVFNGTAANILSLLSVTRSYEAIICAEKAHIQVDECGAPEKNGGFKLIPIPSSHLLPGGKLCPLKIEDALKDFSSRRGDQHASQLKVLSLSNTTEYGAVYSPSEIKYWSEFSKKNGYFFHVDGARISNAAAALGVSLKELTTDAGVDLLSFGGTKNGAIGAEAILFLSERAQKESEAFKFFRKQNMQLASKMRFISVQLTTLLKNNLGLKNAKHANEMAQKLEEGLEEFPDLIEFTHKREANALFCFMNDALIQSLQPEFPFYIWSEKGGRKEVRLMTSFATQLEHVNAFLSNVKNFNRPPKF